MQSILSLIHYIDDKLNMIIRPLVVILSLLVAGGMVYGIVSRSVFNAPFLGLEELLLFAVMWLYMLGASLASREGSHLSADFVNAYVQSQALKDTIRYLSMAISSIAIIAFIIWSYSLFNWGVTMQQSTPVFQLPMFVTQSSIFFSSLLFMFYMLRDILLEINHKKEAK